MLLSVGPLTGEARLNLKQWQAGGGDVGIWSVTHRPNCLFHAAKQPVQIQAAWLSLSASEKWSVWKSCEQALQSDSLVNVKKTAHH